MIEESKIRDGLVFWNECDAIVQFPDSKIRIEIHARLMKIDKIVKNNIATCSVYDNKAFGIQTAVTLDYIEKYGTEITLDDNDRQEMIDLRNAIYFEKTKNHDWLPRIPDSLKERVSKFLCSDFYKKYNIKRNSL